MMSIPLMLEASMTGINDKCVICGVLTNLNDLVASCAYKDRRANGGTIRSDRPIARLRILPDRCVHRNSQGVHVSVKRGLIASPGEVRATDSCFAISRPTANATVGAVSTKRITIWRILKFMGLPSSLGSCRALPVTNELQYWTTCNHCRGLYSVVCSVGASIRPNWHEGLLCWGVWEREFVTQEREGRMGRRERS
jgi:hypothetical protein